MAKAFFRFLRGELNGYYITNLYNMLNRTTQSDKDFFIQFASMQFEEGKIDSTTLYNLGKFAGITLPRIAKAELKSAVRMTESEYDEELDYEFSERGLLRTQNETFVFEHKQIDTSDLPDINTLATDAKRSSLVGTESVEGYIAEDETEVLDDEGSVKPEKVESDPPSEGAYSDFYGNQFLFLAEGTTEYTPVSYGVFLDLFKAIQFVRYNGSTLSALVRITSILCPDRFVKVNSISVAQSGNFIIVSYSADWTVDIDLKQDRLNILLYVIRLKFPQVQMVEAI